jgi:hypothetical protein
MSAGQQRRARGSVVAPTLEWGDLGNVCRELEAIYGATVKVELFTDGANYAGTLFVRVTATVPQMDGPGIPLRAEKYSRWPTHQAKTMEGLVLNLLHRLDHELSKKCYKQQELPF